MSPLRVRAGVLNASLDRKPSARVLAKYSMPGRYLLPACHLKRRDARPKSECRIYLRRRQSIISARHLNIVKVVASWHRFAGGNLTADILTKSVPSSRYRHLAKPRRYYFSKTIHCPALGMSPAIMSMPRESTRLALHAPCILISVGRKSWLMISIIDARVLGMARNRPPRHALTGRAAARLSNYKKYLAVRGTERLRFIMSCAGIYK